MRISFVDRSDRSFDSGRFRPFLRKLASFLDAPSGQLTVLFCGDEEMTLLNGAWRGKRRPTDVLSFPGGGGNSAGLAHIGDLAISVETAARAARRGGRTLSREIETLLAHGILHLLGFDHETDDGTMMRLQAEALRTVRQGNGRRHRSTRTPSPSGSSSGRLAKKSSMKAKAR